MLSRIAKKKRIEVYSIRFANLLIVTSLRWGSHLCVALILKKRCKYSKYLFMLQVFSALFFLLRQNGI